MGRKWRSKMKTMKKLITLIAVVGMVLAIAPAAQAVFIAGTGFEDPADNAQNFTPGGGDTGDD